MEINPTPTRFLRLPTPEQTQRLGWLSQQITESERKLAAPDTELDAKQIAWSDRVHRQLREQLALLQPASASAKVTDGTQLRVQDDGTFAPAPGGPKSAQYDAQWKLAPGPLAGLRLEVFAAPSDAAKDACRYGISEIEAELLVCKDGKCEPRPLKIAKVFADLEDPAHPAAHAIDSKADTAWAPPAACARESHALFLTFNEPTEVGDDTQLHLRLRQETADLGNPLPRFRITAARQRDLVQQLFPPRPKPWRLIGPFPVENQAASLAATHEAEKDPASNRPFPGVRGEVRWSDANDIQNGRSHQLVHDIHGVHGTRFLYRPVYSAQSRDAEIALRTEGWFKLWVNGALVGEKAVDTAPNDGPQRVRVPLKAGNNDILVKVVSVNGTITFFFDVEPSPDLAPPPEVLAALAAAPTPPASQADAVRNFFRGKESTTYRRLLDDLVNWREESARIDRAIVTTLVAKELPKPRDTYFLVRGEYDKPAQKVTPAVFSALLPFPANAPTNRLGLAQWLLDPSHPMTARVTVNRYWQHYFGTGLVKTSDDFGSQGERPTHPDLLDWLATEFLRSGWDVKHLQRLIVTSATYRQTSKSTPAAHARDPENRLLSRGPRHRLDGEVIRDLALAVSGLLKEKIGGPSVKPYEPPGLWEAVSYNNAQRYVQDRGDGNYRRSLYTFWKRQSPPPNMLTFDAPTRETCAVRRPRTNTPMQALATLNDPQFVEASRAFAHRILQCQGSTDDRLRWAFRVATSRVPETDEIAALHRLWDKQIAGFRAEPDRANALLAVGGFQPDGPADRCELAAWSTLANLLLNLDETLTKG
jgi:hypothetical protein